MSWQKKLAQGFDSAKDLLNYLHLPVALGSALAEQQFVSRVPLGFAARMQKGNPDDPLLLQVLATKNELEEDKNYTVDPLTELDSNPLKGLIHKYHGRVLITLTGICAVNCRYCFRRHFPYQDNNPGRNGLMQICTYIAQDPTITEVILSGGDPLLASDVVIAGLIAQLESIPHVHTLRIHTRIPIVLPERIDENLLSILASTSLKKVMVFHCNHAQELDESVFEACESLRKAGCHLLNQSVLLAGINDKVDTLAELSHALFDHGIMPYYLHVLDKVKGAIHFDMDIAKIKILYQELQHRLPGYLLPRLAREVPGKLSKTLLF